MFDKVDWYTRRAPWRQDPATDQQYNLLESLGSQERPKTKGEASDAISRLSRPQEEEVRFLQHFGVDSTRMSQLEAMNAIARIITDAKHIAAWQANEPLRKRDVRKGDRVILLNENNSTWLGEVTAASGSQIKIKPFNSDGTPGDPIEVHPSQLLAREGGARVKHAGNLIPGDLIYTSNHRSGLQYAKIARGSRHSRVTCLRWIESKREWAKTETDVATWDLEILGHESNVTELNAFFVRIEKDRAMWQASSGRSGMVRAHGDPDTYVWQQKQRVWMGESSAPVLRSSIFVEPQLPQPVEPVRVSLIKRMLRKLLGG